MSGLGRSQGCAVPCQNQPGQNLSPWAWATAEPPLRSREGAVPALREAGFPEVPVGERMWWQTANDEQQGHQRGKMPTSKRQAGEGDRQVVHNEAEGARTVQDQ